MRSILLPLIAVLAACGPPAVPVPPEPAPAPPTASAIARRPPIPAEVCRCMTTCIVQNGQLREIRIAYDIARGDTMTTDSLPLSRIAPLTGEYAEVAEWYVKRERIPFRGRRYTQYALPRVLGIRELSRVSVHERVPVFAEAGDTTAHPVLTSPRGRDASSSRMCPSNPDKGRRERDGIGLRRAAGRVRRHRHLPL